MKGSSEKPLELTPRFNQFIHLPLSTLMAIYGL